MRIIRQIFENLLPGNSHESPQGSSDYCLLATSLRKNLENYSLFIELSRYIWWIIFWRTIIYYKWLSALQNYNNYYCEHKISPLTVIVMWRHILFGSMSCTAGGSWLLRGLEGIAVSLVLIDSAIFRTHTSLRYDHVIAPLASRFSMVTSDVSICWLSVWRLSNKTESTAIIPGNNHKSFILSIIMTGLVKTHTCDRNEEIQLVLKNVKK